MFNTAQRTNLELRIALLGPTGAGKTFTGLQIASTLGDKTAVIDTERGSAKRYADQFRFDVVELTSYSVENYVRCIQGAAAARYPVLLIDSLSHAWTGKDGVLEFVDKRGAAIKGNNFAAWKDATPLHQKLVDSILSYPGHVVATMRTKMEHVSEVDTQSGRKVVRKLGLQPIQRNGMEYEFDIVADITQEHTLVVSKSRCFAVSDQILILKDDAPALKFGQTLKAWADGGIPAVEVVPVQSSPVEFAQVAASSVSNSDVF
jgi:hypothetical protein